MKPRAWQESLFQDAVKLGDELGMKGSDVLLLATLLTEPKTLTPDRAKVLDQLWTAFRWKLHARYGANILGNA
jgi:hypothetical protein